MNSKSAKYGLGQVVRHREHPFRGVVFDVDPEFANTEEWWNAIPAEIRPSKDQPFYHLFAENEEAEYVAYVSEQNLVADDSGQPIRHRVFPFRGVIFDVDPEFANTEDWWLAIPEEVRPAKDQPFYHLLAENEESSYVAYVSQQNLLPDGEGEVRHPAIPQIFGAFRDGRYILLPTARN